MGKKLSENTPQTVDLAAAVEKEEKKRDKKEKKKKKNTTKAILLASIAAFLESNGFSKSLSALRSEAELEVDDLKKTYPNLEDVFCKFLESSGGDEDNNIYRQDEQDTKDGSISRQNDENEHDAPTQILKKKRKKNARNDDGTKDGMGHKNGCDESVDKLKKSEDKTDLKEVMSDDKHSNQNNVLDDSCADTKRKNRKKKVNSDSLGEDNAKKKLEIPCETVQNVDHRSQVHDSHVNVRVTKKKRHTMISDSSGECIEGESQGKLKDIVMDKVEELKSVISNSSTELLDSSIKHKDKRKKKTKSTSDSLGENVEQINLEASHKVVDEGSKDLNSLGVENNTQLLGKKDDKGKKKKRRDGSTHEWLNTMSSCQLDKGISNDGQIKSIADHEIQDSLKVPDSGTENTVSGEQIEDAGKNSKKRKRLSSEETRPEMDIDVATKESKQVISEAAEGTKKASTLQSSDTSLQDIESQGLAKKRKMEKSSEDGLLANHRENCSVQVLQEDQTANGHLSKDEKEERSSSKGMTKEKRSAEPKTFNAFQRVKVDVVKFADERLQNNSYWAKGGADTGYGAKAQEILGQVRGRDFRHEKTKKKRGTYRGGEIDLQSHSIKFNYSDDE